MSTNSDIDARTDRILDVAMELAEADGYDAVRIRDVAERADVALGTLYRRFESKEDILAAALERMVQQFYEAVKIAPLVGGTAEERLGTFFTIATQALGDRPKLAAALLRTVASGVPELAGRVLNYQDTMNEILITVMRGNPSDAFPTESELQLSRMLQNLWFAEMVGWTGGLQDTDAVLDHLFAALRTLLRSTEIS